MSDLSSPLLFLLAFQGVIVLTRAAGQILIVCIALRGTAPEQRARILRALRGEGDSRRDTALNSRASERRSPAVPEPDLCTHLCTRRGGTC
jgi:hypothetical protein